MRVNKAFVGVFVISCFAGCEKKAAQLSPSQNPTEEPSFPATAGQKVDDKTSATIPPATQEALTASEEAPIKRAIPEEEKPDAVHQISDSANAALLWQANESTDWNGNWVRRGNTNVFDIQYRNRVNGASDSHVATVVIAGNEVRAEREDQRHYRGRLSQNGMTINGMVSDDMGGTGPWIVTIPRPVVQVPLKPRLAPEGIYFLLRPVSITTDSSIIGLPPGTELRLLRNDGMTMHFTNGEYELDVSKTGVSNDLNVVEEAFGSYAAAQANIANWERMQAAADENRQSERAIEAKKQMLAVESRGSAPASTHSSAGRSNSLEQRAYQQNDLANSAHFKMNSDNAGNTDWKALEAKKREQKAAALREAQITSTKADIQAAWSAQHPSALTKYDQDAAIKAKKELLRAQQGQ